MFSLSLALLCVAGTDGYFKRVNPAFEETLGYSREELLSRPFIEFVHPEDRQRTVGELRNLAAGVPTIRFENCFLRKDGSCCWLAWTAMPQSHTGLIYATAYDATARKQAESALRQSEQRYRALLAAATTYTYSVKLEDGWPVATEHSPGCVAATGYSPADHLSDPYLWIEMVHPDDREAVQRGVARMLSGPAAPPMEHRIVRKDGATRWVRNTIIPHYDRDGRLVRYDGCVEDITERKRAEDRFRQLLESAPDAIVIVDQDSRIVLVNAMTEQLFGYPRQELLGSTVDVLVPEALRTRHRAHRAHYAASPHVRPMGAGIELSGRRKDGSGFPAEISLGPLSTDEGMLVSCVVRDITQRKQMAAAAREREVQFLAAQRIQQRLLPRVAPVLDGFDIAGMAIPAEFTGGDYFHYFPMPDGSLGLAVGDVCGHGLGPALLMASAHTLLHMLVKPHAGISEILAHANRFFVHEIEEDRFVTLFLGCLDPRARSLVYASAGHPTGYVLGPSGQVRVRLESTSLPLGVLPGADFPVAGRVPLLPGDIVVLLTDGLLEARSSEDVLFGAARVLAAVHESRRRPAAEIAAVVCDDVRRFSAGGKLTDDVTVVLIKVGPGG